MITSIYIKILTYNFSLKLSVNETDQDKNTEKSKRVGILFKEPKSVMTYRTLTTLRTGRENISSLSVYWVYYSVSWVEKAFIYRINEEIKSVIHLIPESPNNHISTSLKYARKAGIKTQIKIVLHHICTYDHLLLLAIRIMHTLFGLNLQRQWKNSRNTEDESPGSTWLNFLVKWIKLYFHYFQRVKNSATAILIYCITFILCNKLSMSRIST